MTFSLLLNRAYLATHQPFSDNRLHSRRDAPTMLHFYIIIFRINLQTHYEGES